MNKSRSFLIIAAFSLAVTQSVVADTHSKSEQSRLGVANHQLMLDGSPFFPVGFVFGTTDKEMEDARVFGANSVHFECSPEALFPESADKVSESAVQGLKDICKRGKAYGLTCFPLANGHYLPGWLEQRAGGAPVDVDGNQIGLWFKHSIHDPVFRKMLNAYWTLVASELGNDDNVGALVTWNEPGYGLDATPPALSDYRNDLKKRFPSVGEMNGALHTTFKSFDDVSAPKQPEDNRRYWFDWAEYNQRAFADFFADESRVFHSAAPRAVLSAKHPVQALQGDALFCNDTVLQGASQNVFGCDGYNGSLYHYRDAMEAVRSLNPLGPVITYETHPQASTPALPVRHSSLQLFVQILGGCRGMFYFSYSGEGFGFKESTPELKEEVGKLFRLIRDNQQIFSAPRERADIAVLLANPSVIQYGMVKDPARRDDYSKRVAQTYDMVRNQHFAVDVISDRQLSSKLNDYKVLIVPSLSILSAGDLRRLEEFHTKGGKILAFGRSFERDERFEPIPSPGFLGLKSRVPSPWNRGQMRLTSVVPALQPSFRTELIVQEPEIVDAIPMEVALPGYTQKTKVSSQALVGNQDSYPSVIQSTDGQVIYCAFDSLYDTGLSDLLGGLLSDIWGIKREVAVTRHGDNALEVMTAINRGDGVRSLMIANTNSSKGRWDLNFSDRWSGNIRDIPTGRTVSVRNGRCSLSLPGYGYAVYVME